MRMILGVCLRLRGMLPKSMAALLHFIHSALVLE
jgi:hypothetical protein